MGIFKKRKPQLQLDFEAIGSKISSVMSDEGLDLLAVADQAGISKRKLEKVINGKGDLSFELAVNLSKILNQELSCMFVIKGEF